MYIRTSFKRNKIYTHTHIYFYIKDTKDLEIVLETLFKSTNFKIGIYHTLLGINNKIEQKHLNIFIVKQRNK